jgi:Domain of unknown function (DUF4340)
VDVFRPRDRASYGLDHPAVTITVRTRQGARRVVLGESNAAGSAFYARRDDDPRVMQVGSGLLSALERVFYERDRSATQDILGREPEARVFRRDHARRPAALASPAAARRSRVVPPFQARVRPPTRDVSLGSRS